MRLISVAMESRQIGGRKSVNIFDREAKRKQKNRAALAEDVATYDYLRDEVTPVITLCVIKNQPFFFQKRGKSMS